MNNNLAIALNILETGVIAAMFYFLVYSLNSGFIRKARPQVRLPYLASLVGGIALGLIDVVVLLQFVPTFRTAIRALPITSFILLSLTLLIIGFGYLPFIQNLARRNPAMLMILRTTTASVSLLFYLALDTSTFTFALGLVLTGIALHFVGDPEQFEESC